ncbi:MAG: hypothetical protein ABL902_08100 [Gallionella sp.]
MNHVHLVIPDLFLPKNFAADTLASSHLPALAKLLARGIVTRVGNPISLEASLSKLFGQIDAEYAPIAAIGATYDGLPQGNWLRADPINLRLQRDQMVLSAVSPSAEEARQFCSSLNAYFAGQGMEFFAPHPLRWYLRLDKSLGIQTTPLPELFGCNIRSVLPTGLDATHWHQVFNEIQMLLYAHPINAAREARGESPINSVWFWGEGDANQALRCDFQQVSSDDELVKMFAVATDTRFTEWSPHWCGADGTQLLVWAGLRSAMQRGDLAVWRDALSAFEIGYAQPLWQALQSGKIAQINLEVLAGNNSRCFKLTRSATWSFWRRSKPLAHYSTV